MVLHQTGIQDGVFFFYTDPLNYNVMHMINYGFYICSLVLIILLFICHFSRLAYIYKISKIENRTANNDVYIHDIFPSRQDKDMLGVSFYYIWSYHILTILALIFGLFNTFIGVVIVAMFHMGKALFKCGDEFRVVAVSWSCVKFCVYAMGILRIFNTFNDSSLAYNAKIKICLVVYLIIAMGYTIIHESIFVNAYQITLNNELEWCQIGTSIVLIFITIAVEVLTNIILAVMFLKPAIVLSKNIDAEPES